MTKTRRNVERWAAGILGVVCLVLLLKLVFTNGNPVSAARPSAAVTRVASPERADARNTPPRDDLEHYDPELKMDLLKKIESQELPKLVRNPFEYPPPPPPPRSIETQGMTEPVAPPPPPLPFKAIGYSVKTGGVPEVVITDDQDLYVVHAGETFAKRFRVLSLTSSRVEIEDVTTHQVAQLPIAP